MQLDYRVGSVPTIQKLFSVDPGKNTGWAYFEDGQLSACGLVVCLDTPSIERVIARVPEVSRIVVEVPQVYSGPRAVGDPNDLVQVALCAGWVVGTYRSAAYEAVRPAGWKGQETKEITQKRVLQSLCAAELKVLNAELKNVKKNIAHNMLDAVGIGLWALRRKVGSK